MLTLPARLGLALAVLLPACSVPADSADAGTQGTTQASAASLEPTTGEAYRCVGGDDCPAPPICEAVQCIDDGCVYSKLPGGEPSDDRRGDCRSYVCDGEGDGAAVDDPADLPDDNNRCTLDVCDPGPKHTAVTPGSACEGGYCHADLSCQPCAERLTCEDTSAAEPNQSQSNAHPLAKLDDDDDRRHACEALGSADDVDWFRFDAIDTVLGKVAPAIALDPPELAVCIYFQCKNASTGVTCPDATVAANAPLGQQGCCGHGSFAPALDCGDADEDASVWLVVRRDPEAPAEPSCINYQLSYEY